MIKYEEGKIIIGETEVKYTPSLLAPIPIKEFIDKKYRIHRYSLEIRGNYGELVDIYRELSPYTSALLLIEPERQFLLENGRKFLEFRFERKKDALFYILLTEGNPAKAFVENAMFVSKAVRPIGLVKKTRLPVEALLPLFHFRICPFGEGFTLPSSPARVHLKYPKLHECFGIPRGRKISGRVCEIKDGDIVTIADAVCMGAEYSITEHIKSGEGILQKEIIKFMSAGIESKLRGDLSFFESEEYRSFVQYCEALFEVLSTIPSFLASTQYLGNKRESLIVLWELLLYEPKVYMNLLTDIEICSRDLNVLESFLRVHCNSRMEHPHSSSRRALQTLTTLQKRNLRKVSSQSL